MCGIAGTIGLDTQHATQKMVRELAHRGPDDEGLFFDSKNKISFGHRRLSILDLSPAGHQPMEDKDHGVTITFNGEIYNYKELAEKLQEEGQVFSSTSDTEVILKGYLAYGPAIFEKIEGMWALALYDAHKNALYLSRDPAGMKPLYFCHTGEKLYFASEINALAKILTPEQHGIDSTSVTTFLQHGYIFGTETIYEHIRSMPIGSTWTFSLPSLEKIAEVYYVPNRSNAVNSLQEATHKFKQLFRESVELTLQSDVPVSIFLSGGIDSALVAQYAHEQGASLKAFTIAFDRPDFDESTVASSIASHLGFPHENILMRASDIAGDIEKIFDSFGQPFADTSMLPTYYLNKHAHAVGYKVALTGDGADELFGGYQTHYLPKALEMYRHVPRVFDSALMASSQRMTERFTKLGTKEKLTRFLYGARHPYQKAHALWKNVFTETELSALLTSEYTSDLTSSKDFESYFEHAQGSSKIDETIKVDFMTFLTASCLVKSDICSMQNSLETRTPFLNKRIIEFAWHLPAEMKADLFRTKILLRSALREALPERLTSMPKRGFVPPLASWLCADLKEPMLSLLSQETIANIGFLNYNYVILLIDEHFSRRRDHTKKLWSLMSLAYFYKKNHE